VYGGIGLNDVADTLLQRALVLRRKARGDDHPDVGRSLHALGVNAEQLGRYEAAASLNEAAAAVFRIYGEAQALALARALHSLAHANMRLHRLDDAERQIRESLEIKRRMLGEVHEEVPYGLNILGDVYNYQGRYEEAESVLREVLEIRRELLGDDHLDVGVSYHNLGAALLGLERYAEAEIMYREALVRWLGIYGGEHQETANTMSQMAFAVGRQGRYEESDSLHEVAIGIMRRVGEDHPRLSFNLVRRARILAEAGRFEAAERAMGEAVRIQHRVLGESYPGLPRNLSRLATFVLRQGRFDEAESLLLEGLHLCDANPDEAPACRETMQEAIGAFEEAGRRMSQVILAEGMR
ncbi:MAG: tetratricopeptide repeat protein, partial [Bacteroidota bacterium]